MSMKCSNCGSESVWKNGHHHGRQRFKCKDCGYQFTVESRGRGMEFRMLTYLLYTCGFSLRTVGKLLSVSHKAVHDWLKERHAEQRSVTKEIEGEFATLYNDFLKIYQSNPEDLEKYNLVLLALDAKSGVVRSVLARSGDETHCHVIDEEEYDGHRHHSKHYKTDDDHHSKGDEDSGEEDERRKKRHSKEHMTEEEKKQRREKKREHRHSKRDSDGDVVSDDSSKDDKDETREERDA